MRDAIESARAAGWHLRQTRGHGYGRGFCRRVARGGVVCKVIINTTPQRPEDRARDLVRAIRDCPHNVADQAGALAHAAHLLSGADKLVDAAEDLLDAEIAADDAEQAWGRAQDLLDVAVSSTDEVDRMMAAAQQFESEARRLAQSGWIRGAEASGGASSPSAFLVGAETRVEQASQIVVGVPRQEDPALAGLKSRVEAVKGRIAVLRLRLR